MGKCWAEDTHKLKVKIDGEEIQAEYIEFEHDLSSFKKSFNLWDKITIPFYRIKNTLRDVYWEIRYGFQRMFKGYDYVDTFETYAKFTERYYKILTEYRKNHFGHPCNLTNEECEALFKEDKSFRKGKLCYRDKNNRLVGCYARILIRKK